MRTTTVLLADDHAIIRESVMDLLKQEDGIEIIGEAENSCQAVTAASQLRPDVVVMDIAMPQLHGMKAARQILHASPHTKVIILSAHHAVAFFALSMALGAPGYLNEHISAHDLATAIREVHHGRSFFGSPSLSTPPEEADTSHLTRADAQQDCVGLTEAPNDAAVAQSVWWHFPAHMV